MSPASHSIYIFCFVCIYFFVYKRPNFLQVGSELSEPHSVLEFSLPNLNKSQFWDPSNHLLISWRKLVNNGWMLPLKAQEVEKEVALARV